MKSGNMTSEIQKLTRRSVLRVAGGVSSALAFGGAGGVLAQAQHPYRIVVGFPPGGLSADATTPLVSGLSRRLDAGVEIDYRPGAGGNVAALHVARSEGDGRTLLFGHAGPLSINQHINPRSYFDPVKDLAPIVLIARFPLVICVSSKLGLNNLSEFVDLARSREVVVGSSGNGSIQHLACEIFRQNTGMKFLHVPFAGGGPLQDAFLRGDVEALFETGSNVVKFIIDGKLTPLAVMGHERLAILPDAPPLWELGYPGLDVAAWFGLLAPASTELAVREKMTETVFDVFRDENVRIAYNAMGATAVPIGPSGFAAFIESETDRWRVVVRDAKIKPD
ncbi:MAG: tripartite tricarboxylate transporter substrate binding protein [Beijerinckiaceae bacterium]